jgi:DNA-binding response OmpR family regulator
VSTPSDYTILVVEDETGLRTMIAEHLEDEGYVVLTADTGHEALSLAQSRRFDLILLDVMMPGLSGFDVCTVLRDLPHTRATPIIFLTAVADSARKAMAMRLGATDYLTKPFKLREVTARVEELLRADTGAAAGTL